MPICRPTYALQKRISFDYAVAENEPDIAVIRYAGQWKDVGTWNTFCEVMSEPTIGKVMLDETCRGTNGGQPAQHSADLHGL